MVMSKFTNILAGAGFAAALAFSAGSASATITTFATFQAPTSARNIEWKNLGSNGSNGTSGQLFTIATAGASTPGTVNVEFSFLQPQISPYVHNLTAAFTLFATSSVAGSTSAGQLVQPVLSGTFSFVTTSALTIGTHHFNAGANLLSGVFGGAGTHAPTLGGADGGSSGSFTGSTEGGATVTYSSDFLDFSSTINRDFALNLTSINSVLSRTTGKALRTFKASAGGSFSSDPAPIVTAIPEPTSWALMLLGIGVMGSTLRMRNRKQAAVAAA
jgi:hypothetical protein